uniref:MOR2-PAG1_N domain-containing protein n=1 Tax=Angiostrongylus cantonensis TaxID=6313 RepID=A0A0K0DII0_ANGCA
LDYSLPTGPFAGQSVLLDLFGLFERKLQSVAEEEPIVEFHLSACEQQVKYLLDSSFHQVQYKDPQFMNILSEMKKDNSSGVTHNIISLLMAMKFVKIKTNQVEDFELGIKFLDDLGSFLLEVKDKDIKHAVAGLLVEILLPVAAQIKRETNIPALITFVCKLFGPTNELASKKQHKLAAYPLLTCLLCVSQRQFFLSNWVPFLNNTLANLKNRDSRISRVALESLYRLLWVYMIRNNYDGNSATRTRLESICGSLFPKGNRGIVPRDAPLNIFVKIIHFIAQQKLDFAFKDVIFDLLACNRTQRSLYPERMNIGIRALMVIADGLQQKDEPPSMPKSMGDHINFLENCTKCGCAGKSTYAQAPIYQHAIAGPSASGTMQRLRKKTYITRPLTVDIAKAIGLDQYYIPCRKAFDTILRILDTQVILVLGDVKPKLDLFRTCVAAIPRLLPEPMTYTDLIDILTRITVHIDEELRTMSGNTLQNIMGEFPEWREHVVIAEIALLQNQLTVDFYPAVLDEALRLLHQMIVTWKSAAIQEKKKEQQKDSGLVETSQPLFPSYVSSYASALHAVEGLALVMMCQIRPQPKKIAISLLKEVKQIISILSLDNADTPAITVLDEATPYVVRKYIEHVSLYERMSWNLDFTSACEKIAAIDTDNCLNYAFCHPGVGSMSAVAFEAFLEDLNQRGILRDAMEKKAGSTDYLTNFFDFCDCFLETNVRRRKRKDLLRLQLIRIIEVAVLRGLLESTMLDANGTLNSLILDFVDSMRANLENDLVDRDIAVVTMMRLHFSKLVAVLIDGVGTYNRTNLIPDEKKQSLFYLFTGWCSRTIAADKKIHENEVGSYVEQKATLAMTRLLMCGRIFEMQKSIGEDGYLYGWLEKLVSSANPTMQEEVEEMLALMLELNESSQLLDWLMSQSYSQPNVVAANSSSAVAPPQLASITNNIASTSTSAQLKSQIMSRPHNHCFPIDQQSVCRNLANSYPHLTITIFSEGARIQNRTYLLSLLLPWIENIELVDPTVGEDSWEGPRGWGSEEATHLLLNNLMYLTVYLAPDHENEIAELWRALALSFPANLPVILNYLYIVTVLSCDTLLPYVS